MKIMKIIAETHDIQINKTIRKINETKSCVFFQNINEIDKPLARHIKKKSSGFKGIILEMKKNLQRTPQKYKGS